MALSKKRLTLCSAIADSEIQNLYVQFTLYHKSSIKIIYYSTRDNNGSMQGNLRFSFFFSFNAHEISGLILETNDFDGIMDYTQRLRASVTRI